MVGKIIENISDLFKVETKNQIYTLNSRGKLKKDKDYPVVGDIIEFNEEELVIEKILPRKNKLIRPKIANVDQVILTISAKSPKPDYLMVDKYLAYCNYLGLPVIIVFNKIELDKKELYKTYSNLYKSIGYEVFELSTKEVNEKINNELKKLKEKLSGNLSIFAGNSGVGKSSIINLLFKQNIQLEGDISKKNKKGKNTTVQVKLHKFEDSYIADSPGFSSFDVLDIPSKELKKSFIEFNDFSCEYLDCSHIKEKECNIKVQVANGKISKERYENYCKIYEQIKKEETKW